MIFDPIIISKYVFSSFILNVGGFVQVPGYEPTHLDLEKLFLLSVSKENLDFRRKHGRNFEMITLTLK